jgi:predicted nucleotidyltransferase
MMRTLNRVRVVSDLEKRILLELKAVVAQYSPNARIVLYGSAARGKRQPDSDYDILVITDSKLTSKDERDLDRDIYDIQVKWGVVLSVVVYAEEQWHNPILQASPYSKNVAKDGILL